jgi:hypothetical protein
LRAFPDFNGADLIHREIVPHGETTRDGKNQYENYQRRKKMSGFSETAGFHDASSSFQVNGVGFKYYIPDMAVKDSLLNAI